MLWKSGRQVEREYMYPEDVGCGQRKAGGGCNVLSRALA